MRKKRVNFCILLFAIIMLTNCSKENTNDNHLVLKVDVKNSSQLNIKDWCEKIVLIPLETSRESAITGCFKVVKFDGNYYIQDQRQHAVYVFDAKGGFIFSTNKFKGSGPKEYKTLMDFDINRFTKKLEILDAVDMKIKIYNLDGSYENEISLSPDLLPLSTFIAVSPNIYLFYAKQTKRTDKNLTFYSIPECRILNTTGEIPIRANLLSTSTSNPFYIFNDTISFNTFFPSNYIFQINQNSLEIDKKIEFDFMENNFEIDKLSKNEDLDFYRSFIRDNNNKYVFVTNKKENNRYYIIHFYFKRNSYVLLYNKLTKHLKIGYNEPKMIGQLMPPKLVENDVLYYFSEPGFVKYSISEELLDKDSKMVLKNIIDNDNPIIIKYYLK